jgi:hypothetical protein
MDDSDLTGCGEAQGHFPAQTHSAGGGNGFILAGRLDPGGRSRDSGLLFRLLFCGVSAAPGKGSSNAKY